MHEIDLAQADLNLLVVLDVLLQEKNVTRAAERLHRTQSATSHALSRLRELLDDPILVRVGGQMRPTPKAERLAEELPGVLRTLRRMLGQSEDFDPDQSDRIFTLAAPDFVAGILPSLVGRLQDVLPKGGVELLPPTRGMYPDLADGRLDVVVAPKDRVHEGVRSVALTELEWAVFARRGHPAATQWSKKAWSQYPHIRVRTSSAVGPVDRGAAEQGLPRRLGAYLPHFWLAPPLLASTDMLLTVPTAVLAGVVKRFDLIALAVPMKLNPIDMHLHYCAALERDAALLWFRQLVHQTVETTLAHAHQLEVLPLARRRKRS